MTPDNVSFLVGVIIDPKHIKLMPEVIWAESPQPGPLWLIGEELTPSLRLQLIQRRIGREQMLLPHDQIPHS
jgi:hypothetical protein